MSETERLRRLGDNNPPEPIDDLDPYKLIDVDKLVALFERRFPELPKRVDEFESDIQRWTETHKRDELPPAVLNDQDKRITQDVLNQMRDFIKKDVEDTRKRVKAAVDKAAKIIQTWFVNGLSARLERLKQPIEDALSLYLVQEDRRIREERRQAAWDAQQEAMRLADLARRAKMEEVQQQSLARSIEAADIAEALERQAEAPVLETTRFHSTLGAVGGLKETWHFEVEALILLVQAVAQGQAPIDMLTANESYINSVIRRRDNPVRKVPGLRIYSEVKAR